MLDAAASGGNSGRRKATVLNDGCRAERPHSRRDRRLHVDAATCSCSERRDRYWLHRVIVRSCADAGTRVIVPELTAGCPRSDAAALPALFRGPLRAPHGNVGAIDQDVERRRIWVSRGRHPNQPGFVLDRPMLGSCRVPGSGDSAMGFDHRQACRPGDGDQYMPPRALRQGLSSAGPRDVTLVG